MNFIKNSIKIAFYAFKSSILPALFILTIALTIVLSYYNIDSVNSFFNNLSEIKSKNSYLFSFLWIAFFAAIVPWVIRCLWKPARPKHIWKELFFFSFMWGIEGIINNSFYELQGILFGTQTVWWAILCKVLVDQFIYTPLYASPYNSVNYFFAQNNFSIKEFKANLEKNWYKQLVIPNYVTSLIIWIPATSILYLLPTDLLIVMNGLINSFFAIVCSFVARRQ